MVPTLGTLDVWNSRPSTNPRPRETAERIQDWLREPTSRKTASRIAETLNELPPHERGEVLRLIEGGGDRIQVEDILASASPDPELRKKMSRLVGEARPWMASPGRFVVSDIDDTIRPSRDPDVQEQLYPGASALLRALDEGIDARDVTGDVHLVTARDGVLVHVPRSLRDGGIDFASVRYGRTFPSLASLLGKFEGMQKEKIHDVRTLLARNPDRKAVLIGDTVQADPAVYRRILEESPDRVELIMLHEVRGFPVPEDMRSDPRVLVFKNYSDAARALFDRGLISEVQLQNVISDTCA